MNRTRRIFPFEEVFQEASEKVNDRGDKIVARPVGRWALPYLSRIITQEEYSPPLQQILAPVDLTQGSMFVYAPAGAPTERLKKLEFGGLVPGNWISAQEEELSDIPQEMLIRYLWRWLQGKDGPGDEIASTSQRFLLGEECLWSPGDAYGPEEPPHFLVYRERLYLWASAQDGREWLESLIYWLDRAYPHLLLCAIVADTPVISADYLESLLSGGERRYEVPLIVFGAYDAESYVVWRRRRRS